MAGEEESLQEEVRQLREKVDALQAQSATHLEEEIETYLDENAAWKGAQGGGGLAGISIHARFTAVNQNTLGLDPADRSVVNGDVDLDFDFQVTDNLVLFIYLTANEGMSSGESDELGGFGGFPYQFGSVSVGLPSESFGPVAGSTFQGLTDGIGVNGTSPTDLGSITVREAGIYHKFAIGDTTLHWEAGTLNQRQRFLQNAFADDENTQFIHNGLDDSAGILWLNDGTGRTVFGWHLWVNFGDNDQFTLSLGWFNVPGQFFNRGQLMIQFAWKGEVNGREMNIRGMVAIDEFHQDSSGDGDVAYGASWDWWLTDKIGAFFKFGGNNEDINPIELDFTFGLQFNGLLSSRPDDVIGLGFVYTSANDTVLAGIPEDTEFTIELYYRYMAEDGKLQITPHLIIVTDPGGNASPWEDDLLVIIGIRIFVPF